MTYDASDTPIVPTSTPAARPAIRVAVVGLRGIPATHGGIEQAVEQLSTRMAANGHVVTVYSRAAYTADPDMRTYRGVRIRRLPQLNSKHLEAISHTLLSLIHVITTRRYDVVHIHATGPAMLSFIPRIAGLPTVATIHGLDWQRARWGRFATAVLRFAAWTAVTVPDRTIVVSRDLQRSISESYGKDVDYVSNGVVEPSSSGAAVPDLKPDGFVLFLGRLVPEKQVDTLISAYRSVADPRPLVIAGPEQGDEGYLETLRELAAKDPRVQMFGPAYGDQKAWLLQNASAFVQVSSLEGLPIALLEAIAAGTYPIVSAIPPHLEVLDVGGEQIGHVVPVGDEAGLAETIDEVLRMPEMRVARAEVLHHSVTSRYDWGDSTERTQQIYEEAIDRCRRVRRARYSWMGALKSRKRNAR